MVPAALAVPVVKELISAGAQYMACREQEKTKRAEIAARLDAALTTIDKTFDGIGRLLDENHEQSMRVYQSLETLLFQSDYTKDPGRFELLLRVYESVHKQNGERLGRLGDQIVQAGSTSRF